MTSHERQITGNSIACSIVVQANNHENIKARRYFPSDLCIPLVKRPFHVTTLSFPIGLGTWWRHQMEHFPRYWPFVRGIQFPTQGPVTRSIDLYFDLRPNKSLNKQWWGWWFETPSRPLWRHRDEIMHIKIYGEITTDIDDNKVGLMFRYILSTSIYWQRTVQEKISTTFQKNVGSY